MQTLHNNVIRRDRPLNHGVGTERRTCFHDRAGRRLRRRVTARRQRWGLRRRRSLIGMAQRIIMRILLVH